MDHWYPYNRLGNASSGFQPPGGNANDYQNQQQQSSSASSVPSSTSQLLLQAAHSNSLAPSPFNPGGFLTPPPVAYDMFSPLFHPANTSKAAHYAVNPHRSLASVMSKPTGSELASLRENYNSTQHQNTSYFDQQSTSSSIGWPHANNSQLPTPFGVLPHESVSSATTPAKQSSSDYSFNSFTAAAPLLADYKNSGYNDLKKSSRSESPASVPKTSGAFYHNAPSAINFTGSSSNINDSFAKLSDYANSNKYNAANAPVQQSCIVPTSTSKDYRASQSPSRSSSSAQFLNTSEKQNNSRSSSYVKTQAPLQTKASSKAYPEMLTTEHSRTAESILEPSQPSAIGLDSRYSRENQSTKMPSSSNSQEAAYHHVLSQQAAVTPTYQNYSPAATPESDYHSQKGDSTFSSSSRQNGQKSSPHLSHSPLTPGQSPAYPLYHSPMPSMPSPISLQQHEASSYKVNQQPSPSPIDVSSRNISQNQQNISYPSVITRALPEAASKAAYPTENRHIQSSSYSSKTCWDSSVPVPETSQRKYLPSGNDYNPNMEIAGVNNSHQQPGLSSERPPVYFDPSHHVSLQDLSSCRGDPMSVVKSIQQQQHQAQQVIAQQPCQVPLAQAKELPKEAHPDNKISSADAAFAKRRKSADKTPTTNYVAAKVPPPAHHNPGAQQPQNGTYFDLNRWTAPMSIGQPPNIVENQHQNLVQQQSPVSCCLTFPATPQTCSSESYSAIGDNGPSQTCTTPVVQPREKTPVQGPKVEVPNIEEELAFLKDFEPVSVLSSADKSKTQASGFEASYLKFLQGEPESSPLPTTRGRKSYEKTKEITVKVEKADESNGPDSTAKTTRSAGTKGKRSTYDPEDDPRYFPLPKTSTKRSLESSDEDSDSKPTKKSAKSPKQDGKSNVTISPGKRGRKKKNASEGSSESLPPRRETCRRKAKEKNAVVEVNDDMFADDLDVLESDSDPAWSPDDSSDGESTRKKVGKKGAKNLLPTKKRGKHNSKREKDADGIDDGDKKTRGTNHQRSNSGVRSRRSIQSSKTSDETSTSLKDENDAADDSEDSYPVKVGSFLVIKKDLIEKWPPIWRVDGRTLLQKFEPYEQNGETLYRQISTYSGWSSQQRHIYRTVNVRVRSQHRLETIVELIRDKKDDDNFLVQQLQETQKYQDNFEVYIQTLISQALDSNFLTEIFQEKDDYFLSNVKVIDDVVENRRQRFLNVTKWKSTFETSVATWPCYNIIDQLAREDIRKKCTICNEVRVSARVLLYGQPYNSRTLEGCQPDVSVINEKDFLTCSTCLSQIELYNKIAHQKYLMFIECAKKVSERRGSNPSVDTTVILNQLLADDKWLNELFLEVRTSWAEVEKLERVTS